MTSEEEKAFPCSSAQRTFESSPALQRWENRINWFSKPAEGATETFRIKNQTTVCRPFHGLGTSIPTSNPPMNRWAIFVRPRRGLLMLYCCGLTCTGALIVTGGTAVIVVAVPACPGIG